MAVCCQNEQQCVDTRRTHQKRHARVEAAPKIELSHADFEALR
jgi:hypothetical protein